MTLQGKRIILGVSGGIAVYKAVEVLRRLTKLGAEVRVVMTRHAQEFVTPLTFQSLCDLPVITEMFDAKQEGEIAHITVAQSADLVLVAPATANVIGKYANGIADDFLTTLLLAATAPVMVAPAMNTKMFLHPAHQKNLETLRGWATMIIEPVEGELACKDVGVGKLAEVETIIEAVCGYLTRGRAFDGYTILVTAGPTQEPLDAVRFLTNASSGKMGYAVARAALARGAEVILISGPTSLPPPAAATFVPVRTAREMYDAVMQHFPRADVVIKTAAVSDFRFTEAHVNKIKKDDAPLVAHFARNPDILAELGQRKGKVVLVGFAAETHDVIDYARGKLVEKNLDLIIANDISDGRIGMGSDSNRVSILSRDGEAEHLPEASKDAVASVILDRVGSLLPPHAHRREHGTSHG